MICISYLEAHVSMDVSDIGSIGAWSRNTSDNALARLSVKQAGWAISRPGGGNEIES